MTDYHFTGAYPRILTGLSQGVNALILPADRDTPPYGSTLHAHHGDSIQTDEPYEHPELTEVADEPQPTEEDGTPIPTPKPPKPSRTNNPAPADPTEN